MKNTRMKNTRRDIGFVVPIVGRDVGGDGGGEKKVEIYVRGIAGFAMMDSINDDVV